jgi:hypothetical protein
MPERAGARAVKVLIHFRILMRMHYLFFYPQRDELKSKNSSNRSKLSIFLQNL